MKKSIITQDVLSVAEKNTWRIIRTHRFPMTRLPIPINKKKIDACCKKYHITCLALFGSILTSHFSASSDVDILVKFDKKHIPGLFRIFDIQEELSTIVGREVDLKTSNSLSRYFRDEVLSKAQVLYPNLSSALGRK